MALSSVQATLFSGASLLRRRDTLRSFTFFLPFSSMASSVSTENLSRKKWRRPVVSVLELGGVKISREGLLFVITYLHL